jgi:hypothetical protein
MAGATRSAAQKGLGSSFRVVTLAGLMCLCACASVAAKTDFDKVTAGMTRADVDKALDNLGAGRPAVANDILNTFGGMDTSTLNALAMLTIVEWGSPRGSLFVGFDRRNVAKWKVIKTPDFSALQPIGF